MDFLFDLKETNKEKTTLRYNVQVVVRKHSEIDILFSLVGGLLSCP
jgi:hypothetical protein